MDSGGACFRATTAGVTGANRVSAGLVSAAGVTALAAAGPLARAEAGGGATNPSAPASAQPSATFLERTATPFLGKPFWKTIRTDYPERAHVTPVASPYSRVLSHAFRRRNPGNGRKRSCLLYHD